jgi:hypothetical protein
MSGAAGQATPLSFVGAWRGKLARGVGLARDVCTDEQGVCSLVDIYKENGFDALVMTRSRFLLVEGRLQNQDNIIHVKAWQLMALSDRALQMWSHDFH